MSQISRLRDAEISNGNLINADDLDAELNQLVSESNSQDTRLTSVESGNVTLSGTKTFSSAPKADQIDERTNATGVTVDGVLLKDGFVKPVGASQPYTPAANGEFGYDSTNHRYMVRVNGTNRYLVHDGNLPSISGFMGGKLPTYTDANTVTIPSGFTFINSTGVVFKAAGNITVALSASGAGGLDTGSEASNTHYYLYMIRKSSDGTVSAVWSTTDESVSGSITYPSGYDQKVQLPLSVRNNGSSNIIPFFMAWMSGKRAEVRYDVGSDDSRGVVTGSATNIFNSTVGTGGTTTAASSFIPPSAPIGYFLIDCQPPASGGTLQIRPTGRTDYESYGFTTSAYLEIFRHYLLNSSKQLDMKTSAGTATVTVSAMGYIMEVV